MKTRFLAAVLTVLWKDLRTEFRARELVSAMTLFALLSVLAFSFGLELDRQVREEVIGGVLWVTVIFASVLGLNRSLGQERDQGSIDALLIAPVDRAAIYFGKAIGNFLFALIVGLLLLPLMTILYNITLTLPGLLAALTLGTLGLSLVGTLLAAMTVQTRSRETLLPILMLPMALPILLAVVRASAGIIDGVPAEQWTPWLGLLAAIDVIYGALCALLFDYVVEE
jgi:heme exporter protein B